MFVPRSQMSVLNARLLNDLAKAENELFIAQHLAERRRQELLDARQSVIREIEAADRSARRVGEALAEREDLIAALSLAVEERDRAVVLKLRAEYAADHNAEQILELIEERKHWKRKYDDCLALLKETQEQLAAATQVFSEFAPIADELMDLAMGAFGEGVVSQDEWQARAWDEYNSLNAVAERRAKQGEAVKSMTPDDRAALGLGLDDLA